MGFSGVSQAQLRKIPGLNDFFRKGSSFTELDAVARKPPGSVFGRQLAAGASGCNGDMGPKIELTLVDRESILPC